MKVIVGLGNPEKKYHNTRHNVGFMFVDYLAKKLNVFSTKKMTEKFNSVVFETVLNGERILLIKPQTYMNLSGDAVSQIMSFYKVKLDDLLVIHDDLDISIGSYKLQKGKGPKCHNGILDIEDSLGNSMFWRLRVGIDSSDRREIQSPSKDFVLMRFHDNEIDEIQNVFEVALESVNSEFFGYE